MIILRKKELKFREKFLYIAITHDFDDFFLSKNVENSDFAVFEIFTKSDNP